MNGVGHGGDETFGHEGLDDVARWVGVHALVVGLKVITGQHVLVHGQPRAHLQQDLVDDAQNLLEQEEALLLPVLRAPDLNRDVLPLSVQRDQPLQVSDRVLGPPEPLVQVHVGLGLPVDVLAKVALDAREEDLEEPARGDGGCEEDTAVDAVVVPPVFCGPETGHVGHEVEAGELVLDVTINMALKSVIKIMHSYNYGNCYTNLRTKPQRF